MWRNDNHQSENATSSQRQFQLTVSARFKPKGLDLHRSSMKKISLPLHQRLQLIRMNRNINSQREAFQVLMKQGDWFGGGSKEMEGKEVEARKLVQEAQKKLKP